MLTNRAEAAISGEEARVTGGVKERLPNIKAELGKENK